MSNVHSLLPKLTVNGLLMRDFFSAPSPCFALGLVEERRQPCGFLALRPQEVIPPEISDAGFRFGHSLLGTAEFEVVHFAFEFYGFTTYNVLINPNNAVARAVLTMMVETGDYFFFAISPNRSVTAFRSELGQQDLAGLKANLERIQGSTTTAAQYERVLAQFRKNPEPPGQLLAWICCDNIDYLNLAQDRLDLRPR